MELTIGSSKIFERIDMKYMIILLLLSGCATPTVVEKKRKDVMDCMKDLKSQDASTMDSFEVCRQLYGLRKIDEGKDQ